MTNRIRKYKRQPTSSLTCLQNIRTCDVLKFQLCLRQFRTFIFLRVLVFSTFLIKHIAFELTFVGAASAILQLFDNAIFHCAKLYHFIDGLLVIILEVTTHRTQNVGQVIFHQENFASTVV